MKLTWYLIILGLATISVISISCRKSRDSSLGKQADQSSGSEDKVAAPCETTSLIETREIVIDGQPSDWSGIRPRFHSKPSPTSSYGPRSLSVARYEGSLFLHVNLSEGIEERLETQKKQGKLQSGAVGFIDITVDEKHYRIWMPTGYGLSRGAAPSMATLALSYEIHGEKDGELTFPQHELISKKEWDKNSEYIAFEKRNLEILISLQELGAHSESKVSVDEWTPF